MRWRSTATASHGRPTASTLVSATPDEVVLDVDGVRRRFDVARYGDTVHVDTADGGVRFAIAPRFVDPADQVAAGSLIAPMPGSVVRIAVDKGDWVTAGQPVLWLEAMKMQHQINAPADGVVTELPVARRAADRGRRRARRRRAKEE